MRGWQALVVVAGCAGNDGLAGTLAYTEQGTGHVHVRDLSSGQDTLIDPGVFGSVSIAPDGQHLGYEGADERAKIADRAGHVTTLTDGGCLGESVWLTSTIVASCEADGTALLPSLAASPRTIASHDVVLSPDASMVAYVDATGDLIVESPDGGGHRVLVPSADPAAVNPPTAVVEFTPDQRALIVEDFTAQAKLEIVSLADGTAVTVDDAFFGGSPFGAPRFLGASHYSTDGSRLLASSSTALVAIELATGTKQTIASYGDRQSGAGAVFLDGHRVLWVRDDDHSMGDEGEFVLSVHVADDRDASDVVVDPPGATNTLLSAIAILPDDVVALASDVLFVRTDGTALATNPIVDAGLEVADILAIEAGGVITSSSGGDVHYLFPDGRDTSILTAGSEPGADVFAPFAAYAPPR